MPRTATAACHPEMAKCMTTKQRTPGTLFILTADTEVHDKSRDGLFLHCQGRV